MRDKLNCPNCGAPITSTECPYCGTVFYDFATLDSTRPTYIRMVWNDRIVTSRVVMRKASINIEPDVFPTMEIEFMVVGEMTQQERRTDE